MVRLFASIFLAIAVCALMITVHGLNDRVFPADAAVVFGNDVFADGSLAPGLQSGVNAAYGLYYYGTVRKIVVSGGTGQGGVNAADAMRDYLLRHGVAAENVILDCDGLNTRAMAKFTAACAKERGWERVIAVNQFYQLPRAVLSLKHEGVPVVGSLSSGYFSGSDFLSLLREIPAYFACWAEVK